MGRSRLQLQLRLLPATAAATARSPQAAQCKAASVAPWWQNALPSQSHTALSLLHDPPVSVPRHCLLETRAARPQLLCHTQDQKQRRQSRAAAMQGQVRRCRRRFGAARHPGAQHTVACACCCMQELAVRLVALGVAVVAVNVPCGMW